VAEQDGSIYDLDALLEELSTRLGLDDHDDHHRSQEIVDAIHQAGFTILPQGTSLDPATGATLTPTDPESARSFTDFFESGMLWAINTTLLHPRGFAMGLTCEEDGTVTGWKIYGDGSEPWTFDHDPSKWPEGKHPHDRFVAFEQMLNDARRHVGEPDEPEAGH
jgi:hypothetical protein